jgi:peptidoglycan DL-endopeptidase CwlO
MGIYQARREIFPTTGRNLWKTFPETGLPQAANCVRITRIVTDLGGSPRLSTRHPKPIHLLLRLVPVAGLLAVAVSAAVATTAGAASPLSSEQAKAAQLEAEIQQTGQQIDALDQRYESALAKKAGLDSQIRVTTAQIGHSLGRITKDKSTLHKAAIEAYVSGGTSASADALFSTSQTSAMDSSVYNQVVTGDLNTSMATLHTAVAQLDAQRQTLKGEDAKAAQAVATAHDAYQQAQTLETQQRAQLAQVKGEIATLISQQQAAAQAAEQGAAQAVLAAAPISASPPPPAGGGAGAVAVRAAETQLGVPYIWGAEDPGVGFDCSGLTAWAWGQAGVSLPHYSGSQMADSAPVPISDLQPGDLLFYGPGGDTHVAMYVGGGMMIEATFPGTVVRIDPVRFGATFAGAGRP